MFDSQMVVISVKCGDVTKLNHFGGFICIVHKTNPEMKLNQKKVFYFQNFEFRKWTFLPFLT